MELVEGPTLADRIAQGAIPVDEALPIAKQIAEALEAAHEQGNWYDGNLEPPRPAELEEGRRMGGGGNGVLLIGDNVITSYSIHYTKLYDTG